MCLKQLSRSVQHTKQKETGKNELMGNKEGLASTSKAIYISLFYQGQGFSLAADIQYVDARWKVPVVLPLRDCLSEELNMLCSLDR